MARPEQYCTATTKSGKPCGAYRLSDSDLCTMHDPRRADTWAALRQKGTEKGNRRRRQHAPPMPENLADAARFASWASWAIADGRLGGTSATALRGMLAEYRSLRGALDMAEQVAELKRQVAELKAARAKERGR